MAAELFPIELERVMFTKLSAVAIQAHSEHFATGNISVPPPENNIVVERSADSPQHFAVIMTTQMNRDGNPAFPYSIDIECVAFFRSVDGAKQEDVDKALYLTGHNVAFGAIREAVHWMTGRLPFGPLSLGLSILTPSNK